jgi:hypothetical protein
MQTLEYVSPEARRRVALETLEIYAPLAHRLGMTKVKGDLEDLAFYYLWPHQYGEVYEKVHEKMAGAKEATERIRVRLEHALEEAGIEAEISYRSKRYHSIYQKLRRLGVDVSQLYDYVASASSPRHCATPTRRSASSTRAGAPSRAGSRTTSRCRSPTSTSRCTRRCSRTAAAVRGADPHPRDGPRARRGSPPTGTTRRARPARGATVRTPPTPTSFGCGSSSSGRRRSRTLAPTSIR